MVNARMIYFEGIPDHEIKRACLDLESVGLTCEPCRMEVPGPQNLPEWFIPTAIVLFITRPYLESFLGEMGKDHYGLLKKGVGKLWARFFGKDTTVPPVTVMTASGIRESEYTHTFSVVATTNDNRSIKLMLPQGIGETEFALHVEAFLDFLHRQYAGDDSAVIPKTFSVKGIDDHIFVTLSADKAGLRFLDALPKDVRERMAHNQPSSADG